MRKVITFLGTRPIATAYEYDGETYTGHAFAEALRHFVDFDEMLVFTTEAAAETTWPVIAALGDPRIRKVDIPDGRDTAELWDLFEALTREVDHGDTVIFDITHGLRSIPFLIFLAAAYLKEACDVTIERVLYGAYELGRPAPVIDLSDFVGLLDWLTATDRFVGMGDGRDLAALLRQAGDFDHPRRRLTEEEREAEAVSKRIAAAAGSIERMSQALLTNLIPQAERAGAELIQDLEAAGEDLASQAPPYRLLAERVRATYAPLGVPAPFAGDFAEDLAVQRRIIAWYMEKSHIPQALTLMREWLVTAVGCRLGVGGTDLLDHKGARRDVERALNRNSTYWRQGAPAGETLPKLAAAMQIWPESKTIADLWNQVADLRNLINHAMMRQTWHQWPVETVMARCAKVYTEFGGVADALEETTGCSS